MSGFRVPHADTCACGPCGRRRVVMAQLAEREELAGRGAVFSLATANLRRPMPVLSTASFALCRIEGCYAVRRGPGGLCDRHGKRLKKHGDVHANGNKRTA